MNTQNQNTMQYAEEEETEEQEGDNVWIGGGVIEKERVRQAQWWGNGSNKENGKDMMERAAGTNQKRRQTIIDNEEAVHAYRREVHRRGYRNYRWMPHNASFGFLDRSRAILGQIHF